MVALTIKTMEIVAARIDGPTRVDKARCAARGKRQTHDPARVGRAACGDRKVRLAGVTGRAAIEAEINGQPRSLRLVFLNAWTKTPQGWKFIAWQSTPQPTS